LLRYETKENITNKLSKHLQQIF